MRQPGREGCSFRWAILGWWTSITAVRPVKWPTSTRQTLATDRLMSVYEHLPSYYRVAEGRAYSPDEARQYTAKIAKTHYENFTVVSAFLPRALRQHMFNVYAYCRWADDLGDEITDPALAIEALEWWRAELNDCYAGQPRHPVFVALLPTIRE